ncbi:MAG: helix-turn-helix transcriptional regulator [bacterium]|nr:helix-turn-helix transcriptional regulator [Clostridium sp.]MCM1536932.1 helix-turn-helix transcriptional regulator [bacterium]
MEKYSIGEIIRYLRKEQNMTQEELADGICSNVTISRIENGTQMPSDRIINQLLARLGSDLYYTANIAREKRNQETEQALSRVAEQLDTGDSTKAAALLNQINESDITDAQNKQLYILLKAAIGLSTGTPSTDEIIKELKCGLALTKKNFSFTQFSDVPLTVREANLLNVLCAAYFYHGETGQATALAKTLSDHLIRHKSSFQNDPELLLNAMINLSQLLELEKDYDGALHVCEQAIAISKESRHQPFFAELHFFKAEALLRLGQSEECQKLLSVIYPFMQLQGKTSFTALMDGLYREMQQDPP